MGVAIRFTVWGVPGNRGVLLLFPEGRTYSPPAVGGRWYPSRWSGACALPEASTGRFSRGGRQCRELALSVQAAVQLSAVVLLYPAKRLFLF